VVVDVDGDQRGVTGDHSTSKTKSGILFVFYTDVTANRGRRGDRDKVSPLEDGKN